MPDTPVRSQPPALPPGARDNIKRRVLEELIGNAPPSPGDVLRRVEDALLSEGFLWPKSMMDRLSLDLSDEIFGLGPLESLMRDRTVSEIMVNGPDEVFVERGGRLERLEMSLGSEDEVVDLVRKVIGPLNLRLDDTSPLVDARLPDGSRLNAVLPPISLGGPTVTIRRFREKAFTLAELIECGALTAEMAAFLEQAVSHRANIMVSGGASSGKTTLLNVLGSLIPAAERLITIEDTAELRLDHPHVVSLESRPANIEGRGEITVRDLVRNALRMRPDRIVVGEVRGAEALDMFQAMNTGHPGSLSTAHANSPTDLLSRLETMVLMSDVDINEVAVQRQICSSLDLVVHTRRLEDGRRIVDEIASMSTDGSGDRPVLERLFPRSTSGDSAQACTARGLMAGATKC